jgi:glycosyltransferase involved in cell wall biosynthesis
MTLFTIIIPTYNRAYLLKRSIDSVIEQTYSHWELIIVDDESEDDTENLVRSFNDERIRYIYKKNKERSAARNTGINYSKGDYVCFLDSDDYYLNNHLEEFNKCIDINKSPTAIFYCNTLEDSDGKLTEIKSEDIKTRNNIEFVLQNIIGCPRTCIHKSILKKYSFNETLNVGEDLDLWVRALKEFPLIRNDKYTVVFTIHDNRTVHISNTESIKAHLKLIKKIISEDSNHYISTEVRKQALSYAYLSLARHYEYKKQGFKCIITLIKSIIIEPKQKFKEKIYMIINNISLMKSLLSKKGKSN